MTYPEDFRPGRPAPRPLEALQLTQLVRDWKPGPPLVSIICPTYQQVGFIRAALDGFLGQRTSFPFEVVVRDDASDDGTREIVREYSRNYPGVVQTILESENRYPKIDPLTPLIIQARGEYLALCEGDDYWTDPDKLSNQVEVLQRTGAPASHHAQVEVGDGVILAPTDTSGRNGRDRSGTELLTEKKTLLTRTIMVRRDVVLGAARQGLLSEMWAVDAMITILIGLAGGSRYADVTPAVYRVHDGGISTQSKRDLVLRYARKSSDARHIAALLGEEGEQAASATYRRRAQDLSAMATVGLLGSLPRLIRQREFDLVLRRVKAVRRATTWWTLPAQLALLASTILGRILGRGSK